MTTLSFLLINESRPEKSGTYRVWRRLEKWSTREQTQCHRHTRMLCIGHHWRHSRTEHSILIRRKIRISTLRRPARLTRLNMYKSINRFKGHVYGSSHIFHTLVSKQQIYTVYSYIYIEFYLSALFKKTAELIGLGSDWVTLFRGRINSQKPHGFTVRLLLLVLSKSKLCNKIRCVSPTASLYSRTKKVVVLIHCPLQR